MKFFIAAFFILLFADIIRANEDPMMGLSNHGANKNQPYVTAGDRIYLIGTQDGNFPDMGDHVKGEMGGLWLHPIKLLDGFWAKISDLRSGEEQFLSNAAEFINYPYGNRFLYAPALNGLQIERFQFCPDQQQGMIVQYIIRNTDSEQRNLKFEFLAKTDLSPVWYSKEIGIKDAADSVEWNARDHFFIAKDAAHPWFAVWGSTAKESAQRSGNDAVPEKTIGQGTGASISYEVNINPRDATTLTFIIAGSAKNQKEAIDSHNYLAAHYTDLLQKKKKHFAAVLSRARIRIPDPKLQQVYDWVKINTEWLIREVPGIGRGLGGGLMEYPWWFGTDGSYSMQAVMATGDFDIARQTLRLLKNESLKKNGNGRIVHEISTNGAIPNRGNTQETAQFIVGAEKLFEYSGDLDFLKEMYPVMKMGIHWLLTDMDQNEDLFPEGYGIMEVKGLNAELIDVAVYTQQALEATARVAAVMNEPQLQQEYQRLALQLAEKINRKFWDEAEGSYCDFYGSRQDAIRAADGMLEQIQINKENSVGKDDSEPLISYYQQLKNKFLKLPDIKKGWITNKNWVITTPMETGIAPRDKAIPLLDKIRKENVGEYGPFLSAADRNAMMTISTGVQAVSELNYGRVDEGLWYMNKIVETSGRVLPGSISEMMPDYGCFAVGWTSYGIDVPIIRYIFGIQPDAFRRKIIFEPHLPTGWENISIEKLPVGSNTISFSRLKSGNEIEYTITSDQGGWNLFLKLKPTSGANYFLNGKQITLDPAGIRMSGKINKLICAIGEQPAS